MLIRLGYDIEFAAASEAPIVALLNVHPSLEADLRQPDLMRLDPNAEVEQYLDSYGNICSRLMMPAGTLRLWNRTLIENSGEPDPQFANARQNPVQDLPPETLRYLLSSRYCEVDLLSTVAGELFGAVQPGWGRVQAVCDWVHAKITFGYQFARPTKTALDVYTERTGVCRDFQHLAISFCRSLNIPARYATGYLGDIRIPPVPGPMDFSAWFEVYLEDRWWTFDARHNTPRIGRVLMAVGRDAADVAITTTFGASVLRKFEVIAEEVDCAAPGQPCAL